MQDRKCCNPIVGTIRANEMTQLLTFDGQPLTIEDVSALSRREKNARLSSDAQFLSRIEAGAGHVSRTLSEHGVIYGVTTGYGDSVTTPVPPELASKTRRTSASSAP
jgi:histidine ammonia-lyase